MRLGPMESELNKNFIFIFLSYRLSLENRWCIVSYFGGQLGDQLKHKKSVLLAG